MAKAPNDDLFANTTMTFGEHLEELRACLVRSLVGLVVGCLIGLLFANSVVRFIESPLKRALSEHYSKAARQRLEAQYGEQVSPTMLNRAAEDGLVFEEVLLEVSELRRLLDRVSQEPSAAQTAKTAETAETGTGTGTGTGTADRGAAPLAAQQPEDKEALAAPAARFVRTRLWRAAKTRITILSPHEAFMIFLKAAVFTGLLISAPYIWLQVWSFVAAGLYPHEKRYVHVFLPFSLVLFAAGAVLAFFFVFGPVLEFLFSFARAMNIEPDLRISEVISFVLFLPIGFGIAFQLPLVMLFLNRVNILTVESYLEKWRVAILVIFVISMLLTPADPVSMLLMAVPLTGLYFLGVGLCQWLPRGRNPFDEAYDPA